LVLRREGDDVDLHRLALEQTYTAANQSSTVGVGFCDIAKPDFSGTDEFSKNFREDGYSTVEITVSRRDGPLTLSAVSP
jgi:hypothetical protein